MKNMQVLVLVLNRYEKLSKLLLALNDAGIHGTTVMHSTGMAQFLSRESDTLLGSLRDYFTPEQEENRTLFMVLDEERIAAAKEVIHEVIGPLDKPGTGILFVLPALYVEGISQ